MCFKSPCSVLPKSTAALFLTETHLPPWAADILGNSSSPF